MQDGECLPDGLLVTFKPGTDANDTLTLKSWISEFGQLAKQ